MKAATRKPGVVTYRGRIYVVGGMGKEKDLNHVQIFNPVTEEWEDNQKQIVNGSKSNLPQGSDESAYVPPLEELCGKRAAKNYFNKIALYLRVSIELQNQIQIQTTIPYISLKKDAYKI